MPRLELLEGGKRTTAPPRYATVPGLRKGSASKCNIKRASPMGAPRLSLSKPCLRSFYFVMKKTRYAQFVPLNPNLVKKPPITVNKELCKQMTNLFTPSEERGGEGLMIIPEPSLPGTNLQLENFAQGTRSNSRALCSGFGLKQRAQG